MFTSSVRRAAFSAQPSPIVASLASSTPRAVSTQSCRPLQRRYSSSKPSNPADGRKGVAEGSVPAQAQARADGAKKEQRAKKAKDVAADCTVKGRDESMQNLPSVPSTHHLQIKEIAASAFFSLHRPISVTAPFPTPVTPAAFAAIFAQRARGTGSARVADVLSTLSSTVHALEGSGSPAQQQDRWAAEADQLRAAIAGDQAHGPATHLDGFPADAANIPFPQHILSGRYQPFNAPPAPVPMDTAASVAAAAEAAAESETTQHRRTYTATLTIEESTAANGEVTYVAHSSPLQDVEEPETPARFRDRMNIRQQRHEEERAGGEAWAISVKRQRKLKMKKHKYKKLMRRTRNLRRRLDRN